MVAINNTVSVKFSALNKSEITAEESFTIKDLKTKYPKLWLKSQGDYQVFINLCMNKWIEEKPDIPYNVITYNLEEPSCL